MPLAENQALDSVFKAIIGNMGEIRTISGDRPFITRLIPTQPINSSEYSSPWSPSNLSGSQFATERFATLANHIPSLSNIYTDSGRTVGQAYEIILNTATFASGESSRAAKDLFQSSQLLLNLSRLASLQNPGLTYYGTYSTPSNWADESETSNWTEISKVVEVNGELAQMKLGYLQVSIERPWFNFSIFSQQGWELSTGPGSISNGTLDNNSGYLALVPVSILLTRRIRISNIRDETLFESPSIQLMAYFCQLVRESPPYVYKWTGKTADELALDLPEIGLSVIILLENNTSVRLEKIYENRETGIFVSPPESVVKAYTGQGFSTLQEVTSGPEGWIVYSFTPQHHFGIYWQNFLTSTNKGIATFIPSSISLNATSLLPYTRTDGRIGAIESYACDMSVPSGFGRVRFKYSLSRT